MKLLLDRQGFEPCAALHAEVPPHRAVPDEPADRVASPLLHHLQVPYAASSHQAGKDNSPRTPNMKLVSHQMSLLLGSFPPAASSDSNGDHNQACPCAASTSCSKKRKPEKLSVCAEHQQRH